MTLFLVASFAMSARRLIIDNYRGVSFGMLFFFRRNVYLVHILVRKTIGSYNKAFETGVNYFRSNT